jgi:hypothetical protein
VNEHPFHFAIPGVEPNPLTVVAEDQAAAEEYALYQLGLRELPEGTTISEEI